MDALEEKIDELIQPVFQRSGIHLVGLKLRGALNNRILSIFADTDTGITLDEITRLTREIGDLLDMYDPIPGRYRLEVSSPGIDWPLTEEWQFRKNTGRILRVVYQTNENETNDFTGILQQVGDQGILLKNKKEEEIRIPINRIVKAVVKLSW